MEAEGVTIDDAVNNALEILGVERDRVTVDILAEGRKGILWIGGLKARVRVSLRGALVLEGEGQEGKRDPVGQGVISDLQSTRVSYQ